jgi:endonuclease-3 related protein
MSSLHKIYYKLMELYGPQGWWPLTGIDGCNPTKTGSINGYHPDDYSYPRTFSQQFEIAVGAVLAQNTNWPQAEKALLLLKEQEIMTPKNLLAAPDNILHECVRPAGYFNQKSNYLRNIARFFQNGTPDATRDQVLGIKGVGNETADAIMLYALKKPEFVIDAYTKRIFCHLGIFPENTTYMQMKQKFEKELPKEVNLYQEYHALIVEHAKRFYSKKPWGVNCPLKS